MSSVKPLRGIHTDILCCQKSEQGLLNLENEWGEEMCPDWSEVFRVQDRLARVSVGS